MFRVFELVQIVCKALPFITIRVVRWVKQYEGEDVYDHDVSYNIFAAFSKEKNS
jgi:hypothetical protein